MINFLEGAVYSLGFLSLLFAIEYLTRLKKYPKEITRRVAHIASGLFGAIMGIILEPWVFITFVLFFLLIISVSYVRKFFSSIHGVKRRTFGEIFLPMGILAAFLISGGETTTYLVSVLILSISDPIAGFLGDLQFDKKRILGSSSFFLCSLLILFLFLRSQPFSLLILQALLVTLVERISKHGTDNLFIPISTSLLLKVFL